MCRIWSTEPEEELGGVFVGARGEEGGEERGDERKRGGFEGMESESSKEGISRGDIGQGGEERGERTKGGARRREEKRGG